MRKIILLFIACLSLAVTQQHAAPPNATVDLRIEPDWISPNGDNIQDDVFFYPVFSDVSDVGKWQLTIHDHRGKLVQRLSGASLPSIIKWDALTRKKIPAPEGRYSATLQIWWKRITLSTPPKPFHIDNTPPQVGLTVSTTVLDQSILMNERIRFNPQVNDASPTQLWQWQVVNRVGQTVAVQWSSGSVRTIEWDGKDSSTGVLVPLGLYRCAFQIWDKAGNESAPALVDLDVKVSAREMLMAVLKIITVHETPMGLIVPLQADHLFTLKNGRPVFHSHSDAILREVAILANAYSDAPIKLDGYSRLRPRADNDRNLSSLYAWAIYSALVKKGNVKASRIQVRGRGRSPMFERRGLNVPLLRDGVEVILEGNGEW